MMRRYLGVGLGALSLVVTAAAGSLAVGVAAPSLAGATPVAMGTASGGAVSPVPGTTHADFPDPAVVYSGTTNTYYAYGTGTAPGLGGIPASWTGGGIGTTTIGCTTSHCTDQTARTVAMSLTSAPASITRFWGLQAPSVVSLNNQWVMYYAGLYTGSPGYAVYCSMSHSPTSGFGPTATHHTCVTPLMYQTILNTGGSTDPSVFIKPTGQPWLLWKSGTYSTKYQTHTPPHAKLWSMRLATSGTAMNAGTGAHILGTQPAGGWTGTTTVENPQMVWSGGTYYLFYSGGHWTQSTYGEGYMTCSAGVTGSVGGGTCGTPNTHEILSSHTSGGLNGPGGGSLFTTSTGSWLMAFHSWGSCTGYSSPCNGARQLYVRPLAGLNSTSVPNISSFVPTPTSTIGPAGETITLKASATRAVTYTFTSSSGLTMPPPDHTTAGEVSVTVHVPANTSTTPKHYTFTVTVTGPYGGQASKGFGLTQETPTPTITSFTATPPHLNSSGGTVKLSLSSLYTSSYSITSSPPVTGLPGTPSSVTLPPNTSNSPITYTFTVTTRNHTGRKQATAHVVVAASGSSIEGFAATGLMLIANRTPNNSAALVYRTDTPNKKAFSAPAIYDGAGTSLSDQTEVFGQTGSLFIFSEGANNTAWVTSRLPTGKSNPPLEFEATRTTYSSISTVMGLTGTLFMFNEGPNHSAEVTYRTPTGGHYHGPYPFMTTKTYSTPTATLGPDGTIYILAEGPNHTAQLEYRTPTTGTFHGPIQIEGANTTCSDLEPVFGHTGAMFVFNQGPTHTGTVAYSHTPTANKLFTGPGKFATAKTVYSAPMPIVGNDGTIYIAYQGPTHTAQMYFRTPSTGFFIKAPYPIEPAGSDYSAPIPIFGTDGTMFIINEGQHNTASVTWRGSTGTFHSPSPFELNTSTSLSERLT
jgi:hypothetical protein